LGEIVVRVDNVQVTDRLPLVLLLAAETRGSPASRLAEVVRQPGTGYCVARFEAVPPGQYVVAFEPLDATPHSGGSPP
jgi:hypothetical protein